MAITKNYVCPECRKSSNLVAYTEDMVTTMTKCNIPIRVEIFEYQCTKCNIFIEIRVYDEDYSKKK